MEWGRNWTPDLPISGRPLYITHCVNEFPKTKYSWFFVEGNYTLRAVNHRKSQFDTCESAEFGLKSGMQYTYFGWKASFWNIFKCTLYRTFMNWILLTFPSKSMTSHFLKVAARSSDHYCATWIYLLPHFSHWLSVLICQSQLIFTFLMVMLVIFAVRTRDRLWFD